MKAMKGWKTIYISFLITGYLLYSCTHKEANIDNIPTFGSGDDIVLYSKKSGTDHTLDGSRHYIDTLRKEFEDRRNTFFDLHRNRVENNIHAALVQLYIGERPSEEAFTKALQKINRREDCADFRMIGLMRFVYQFPDTELVSEAMKDSVRQAILNFKYWPDEPGIDNMCTWSENHHILFSTCEYLAGRYYTKDTFSNSGHTGLEKYERGKKRVLRWLDLRFQTGFSEWLSNVYYPEDIAPLVALIDFSPDSEIQTKAAMVLDLMLLDMALNHFKGTFGSTHGRSYFSSKISGNREGTRSIYKLLFDLNQFDTGNMATSALSISENYQVPAVLYAIANDEQYGKMVNYQRMGLDLNELNRYNLDVNRLEDGMTFLSLEAYCHPKTIDLTMQMFDEYHWWENSFFKPFAQYQGLLTFLRKTGTLPLAARLFNKDLNRNTRTEVNIYTFKTPDYLLSSAQDYKKGYGGDQQSIWSAVLDREAIVFTTHPVGNSKSTPDYWTGSGNLPRVGQFENIAIILYKISTAPGLYVTHDLEYTHAWFPKEKFDTVVCKGNWIFGARGNGYIGLWSQNKPYWATEEEFAYKEIIAEGKQNIWICEMGNKEDYSTFEEFMQNLSSSEVKTSSLDIAYNSPSQGYLEFGWERPLKKENSIIHLNNYHRYKNHYVGAVFPAEQIDIKRMNYSLFLDFKNLNRFSNGFIN